jgi:hypothetical protein
LSPSSDTASAPGNNGRRTFATALLVLLAACSSPPPPTVVHAFRLLPGSDLRAGIQHNLELEGFNVHTAADGREGLRKARDGQAALILLDLMLPGMPGLEVLRQDRKSVV